MSFAKYARVLAGTAFLFAFSTLSHAQGGSCKDPWINQGYNTEFHRAPSGSGTSGECNINLYGGGSWTSQQDLFTRIAQSKDCSDPWIGQIYWYLYNRRPTAQECVTTNYGGGSWSSYMDLTGKIQAYQTQIRSGSTARTQPNLGPSSPTAGGSLISHDGGSVVAAGAGNVVNAGGANMTGGRYSVQSVPAMPHAPAGKYLVAPNGALVNQSGSVVRNPGTYRLGMRNGALSLSTPGNVVPSPGAVVNP